MSQKVLVIDDEILDDCFITHLSFMVSNAGLLFSDACELAHDQYLSFLNVLHTNNFINGYTLTHYVELLNGFYKEEFGIEVTSVIKEIKP